MSAFSDYYANANENWFGIGALKNRIVNKARTFKNAAANRVQTIKQGLANRAYAVRDGLVDKAKTIINPIINPAINIQNMARSISSPAHLVVGAHPYESRFDSRVFFDDEHYYMLDINDMPTDHTRFIQANLTDKTKMTVICSTFKQKFDTIIMDCGVSYFVREDIKNVVQHLMQMTKPGGSIIIPKQLVRGMDIIKGETQANRNLKRARLEEESLSELRRLGSQLEIKPIVQIINENEVARRIYEGRMDGIKCPNDAIVITVPIVTGGKYKSRRHKKTKRSKTRRH
jgi:hypothetical protein